MRMTSVTIVRDGGGRVVVLRRNRPVHHNTIAFYKITTETGDSNAGDHHGKRSLVLCGAETSACCPQAKYTHTHVPICVRFCDMVRFSPVSTYTLDCRSEYRVCETRNEYVIFWRDPIWLEPRQKKTVILKPAPSNGLKLKFEEWLSQRENIYKIVKQRFQGQNKMLFERNVQELNFSSYRLGESWILNNEICLN